MKESMKTGHIDNNFFFENGVQVPAVCRDNDDFEALGWKTLSRIPIDHNSMIKKEIDTEKEHRVIYGFDFENNLKYMLQVKGA
jgi:hypothetical protein